MASSIHYAQDSDSGASSDSGSYTFCDRNPLGFGGLSPAESNCICIITEKLGQFLLDGTQKEFQSRVAYYVRKFISLSGGIGKRKREGILPSLPGGPCVHLEIPSPRGRCNTRNRVSIGLKCTSRYTTLANLIALSRIPDTDEEKVRLCKGLSGASHICHDDLCANFDHIVVESAAKYRARLMCKKSAIPCFEGVDFVTEALADCRCEPSCHTVSLIKADWTEWKPSETISPLMRDIADRFGSPYYTMSVIDTRNVPPGRA